ncbi:MAG: hypothetical protein RL701_3439 [Pseudomonadota bacterium]|jgi:uncharacterized membrane protein YphA (DoxX/SURF4 family)
MSRPTDIDFEGNVPDRSVAFGQTLLRIIVGTLLATHGVMRLLKLDVPGEAWIQHYTDINIEWLTRCVAAVEIAAGAGLVIGWFTRLCALVLLCRSALALATHYQVIGLPIAPGEFELPLVLLASALPFCFAGGGPLSLDVVLRERAARKEFEEKSLRLPVARGRGPVMVPPSAANAEAPTVATEAASPTAGAGSAESSPPTAAGDDPAKPSETASTS